MTESAKVYNSTTPTTNAVSNNSERMRVNETLAHCIWNTESASELTNNYFLNTTKYLRFGDVLLSLKMIIHMGPKPNECFICQDINKSPKTKVVKFTDVHYNCQLSSMGYAMRNFLEQFATTITSSYGTNEVCKFCKDITTNIYQGSLSKENVEWDTDTLRRLGTFLKCSRIDYKQMPFQTFLFNTSECDLSRGNIMHNWMALNDLINELTQHITAYYRNRQFSTIATDQISGSGTLLKRVNGHSALQDYNGIEKGDDNGNDNITVNTVKIKDDDIIPEKESTLTINNSSELLSVPKNISDNNNIRKKLYNSINNMEKLLIFLKENNVQVSINVDIVRRCKSSIPNNKHDFHFISSEVCQVELMKDASYAIGRAALPARPVSEYQHIKDLIRNEHIEAMPLVCRRYALGRNVLDYVKGYMDLRNTEAEYSAPPVDLTNAKDKSLKVIYVNKQWKKSKSSIPTENDVTENKASLPTST